MKLPKNLEFWALLRLLVVSSCHPLTIARSRIGARSSPVGMVPNAPPHDPPILVARKASVTAGWPWRTSSEPCSARLMSSAILRARYWIVSRSSSAGLSVMSSAAGLAPAVGAQAEDLDRVRHVGVAEVLRRGLSQAQPAQHREVGFDMQVDREARRE